VKLPIFLFKNVPEGMIEVVIQHETLHMALYHIGENPDIIDSWLTVRMTYPIVLLLDLLLTGSETEIEGLEASLAYPGRQIRRKLAKHQFVEL
jgi:hypothetical protein